MSGNDTAIGDQMVNAAICTLVEGALKCVEANQTAALRDALRVCERAMMAFYEISGQWQLARDDHEARAWINLGAAAGIARRALGETEKP